MSLLITKKNNMEIFIIFFIAILIIALSLVIPFFIEVHRIKLRKKILIKVRKRFREKRDELKKFRTKLEHSSILELNELLKQEN